MHHLAKPWSHRLSAVVLVVIGGLTYTAYYQPLLFSDDWSYFVMPMAQHSLNWLNVANRRPLLDTPATILQALVGLNIDALYAIAWVVTLAIALQLYWVLQRLLPRMRYVALLVAALTLVYPADLSQMWLTHTLVGRVAWLMTLVAVSALITFVERRRYVYLAIATVLAVVAPLLYEAALGVLLTLCALLAIWKREVPWRDRRWVLLPAGLNMAYMVWRSLGYQIVGIDDPYLAEITLDIGRLFDRLILGFKSLLWAWTEPVRGWLALTNNGVAGLLIVVAIGSLWAVIWLLTRRQAAHSVAVTSRHEWVRLLGVGVVFACAGYFPVLVLYEPNLDTVQSRVNLWAIPGMALCIVASLALAAQQFAPARTPRFYALISAGVAVLLGIGILTQLTARAEASVAWTEQKHIWQELFQLAPQIKEGTAVYFVLPNYKDRVGFVNLRRLPLSNSWEATAALNVLYDQTSLHGDVTLPDAVGLGEPGFEPAGVRDFVTDRLVSYSDTLFVVYSGTPRRLTVVTDLQRELGLTWPTPDYAPESHILRTPPPPIELRRLVADG